MDFVKALTLTLGLLALQGRASADAIFTDLASDGSYSNSGFVLRGSSLPLPYSLASVFTTTSAATMTSIDVGLEPSAVDSFVTIELATNTGGDPATTGIPGTVLEAWSNVNINPIYGNLTTVSSTGVSLDANTLYWLVVLPGAADTDAGWNYNSTAISGVNRLNDNNTGWNIQGYYRAFAFDVLSNTSDTSTPDTATPEPSSQSLIAIPAIVGLFALIYSRRPAPVVV